MMITVSALQRGFAAAWIGGVSSGKSTCLASCVGSNHARYWYDNIWLMHPDAEAAKNPRSFTVNAATKAILVCSCPRIKTMCAWTTSSIHEREPGAGVNVLGENGHRRILSRRSTVNFLYFHSRPQLLDKKTPTRSTASPATY